MFADLTKLLEWNETQLCPQNKDLTAQRDQNGSTPLHFAAAINFMIPFGPTKICRQVLEANPILHLAVKAGNLQMFCPLLANPHVNLNLPNNRGETPLDISGYKLPERGFYNFKVIHPLISF